VLLLLCDRLACCLAADTMSDSVDIAQAIVLPSERVLL